MAEPQYIKPGSQEHAERVTDEGYEPDTVVKRGTDPGLSDNGFVNVAPEYQNFANDVDKPGIGDEGAEGDVQSTYHTDDVDFDKGATDAGESDESDDGEPSPTGTPQFPPTP